MLRADHVVFPIWDAGASLAFYEDVLGLPLIEAIEGPDWGGRAWLMLIFGLEGGGELVLVALRGAQRPKADDLPKDVRHYAFSVADAESQEAIVRRLGAAAVEYWREDHADRRSIYFEDPNGMVLEVTTPASPTMTRANAEAGERARRWIAAA